MWAAQLLVSASSTVSWTCLSQTRVLCVFRNTCSFQHFNFQLTHTVLKNVKLLKHFKIRKNAFFLILKSFNNSAFFNVVCVSWKLKCWIWLMHGVTMKFIEAQQAKLCNTYKNTRLKLLKTKSALWFNKMCRLKHLKPDYIHFKTEHFSLF